jgi:hypothetical protein
MKTTALSVFPPNMRYFDFARSDSPAHCISERSSSWHIGPLSACSGRSSVETAIDPLLKPRHRPAVTLILQIALVALCGLVVTRAIRSRDF